MECTGITPSRSPRSIERALQICSRVIIHTPGFVFFRSVISLTAFYSIATGIRPLQQERTGYQPYERAVVQEAQARFSSNDEPFV